MGSRCLGANLPAGECGGENQVSWVVLFLKYLFCAFKRTFFIFILPFSIKILYVEHKSVYNYVILIKRYTIERGTY